MYAAVTTLRNEKSRSDGVVIQFPGAQETVNQKQSGAHKRGGKSEVYTLEIEDMKKIIAYFKEHEQWLSYMIFVLSCNMARRVGDTLQLAWKDIFDPETGLYRKNLEVREEKTDKFANPYINKACRDAIDLYISKTGCMPSKNDYCEPICMQLVGTHKGKTVSYSGYLKALKTAAKNVGITYNVGTHSPRKTFGRMSRMLHPNDYDSMELLQSIYNHSDSKTTKRYIGLTKEKMDQYFDDMGIFFSNYVVGDMEYAEVAKKPVVSIDVNDLRDVIAAAYKAGYENSANNDVSAHIEAVNSIMTMIEELAK